MLLMMIAAFAFASCGSHNHDDHKEGEEHAEGEHGHEHEHEGEIVINEKQAKEAGITIETVAAAPFRAAILVSGQIVASQGDEQTIAATSNGIVKYANASITEGTAVKAGQTIASVSAKNIQDGDPMAKAKAAYEVAKSEYERAKALVGDKIISQKEFGQIKMQYETARVAYEAQARNSTAAGISVSSPMSGYIKTLLVAQGEYVAVGQPIAIVTNSRKLQLRADVPCNQAQSLATIGSANFRMAGSDRVYSLDNMHGRLLSYGRSVAAGSSFVPVNFEFDNIGDIISGAYAEVWLLSKEQANIISVPVEALTEEQGAKFVYVQIEHDAYMKREVSTGASNGKRVEIVSGLKAGEKVVSHGAYTVKLASASKAIPGHTHNH